MPRESQVVRVAEIRPGDEVRFSSRDKKAHPVTKKEDAGGTQVKVTLANGAVRTYDVGDQIIRLDPKPDSKSDAKKWHA